MIYRSNLTAPDLAPHFKFLNPPIQMLGHDIPSDPNFDPRCGSWSHDEAAILYNCAKSMPGTWVDIGSRLGWTSAHLCEAGCKVVSVDPALKVSEFFERFKENIAAADGTLKYRGKTESRTSGDWFRDHALLASPFDGFVIDGDHDYPQPLLDAMRCHSNASRNCVIALHDFLGGPIQDAVIALIGLGWKCRVYDTPNGVAVCWRGDFTPPDHIPDPRIDWASIRERMGEGGFPYGMCV